LPAGVKSDDDVMSGSRLILLAPDGSTRVLTAGFESACDPDVANDGKHVLFAGKIKRIDPWAVFELDLDDLKARQVTNFAGSCRSPIHTSTFYTITESEPWEQIAFVGTRPGQADEYGGGEARSLYTCRPDGSFLQRITYNLSSDRDPAIMADGRLLYSSWRRATFEAGIQGKFTLETINTDGSDRALFVPNVGGWIKRMPCLTVEGLAVFVESDAAAWDGAGRLASVSLRRPLHTYRAITGPGEGLFHSPAALPDGRILVAWRPSEGPGSLGLYLLDLERKRRELVLDDPSYHEVQARPVVTRRRPDGRSSVVSPEDPLAKFYCMNVYRTEFKDSAWLPRGSVKGLRVIEGIPVAATTAGGKSVHPGDEPRLSARRILAEVPVKDDGSFHLTVPANTPIQLQILDDQGIALRSCGWIWARSHQAQGCIGCHEDPELTPPNRVTEALRSEPELAAVPVERRVAVDFVGQVAPIVASRCLPCHHAGASQPSLEVVPTGASAEVDIALRRLYRALLARDNEVGGSTGTGKYVHPGNARTSPLVWHFLGRNTARPWDGAAAAARPAKPMPVGQGAELTDAEKQTIIRWIDLGAQWKFAP
jgi:hypothetical protein